MLRMIVCSCHRVSSVRMAQAIERGCADFDTLQQQLGLGYQCGKCLPYALEFFEAHTRVVADGAALQLGATSATTPPVLRPD
jgi:bacterioferritin-associated ferredoxin